MNSGQTRPIVFFGTEDFSLGTLRTLVEADYPIALVVTKPDAPQGRGHKLTPPIVKTYAEEHGIPVLQPQKLAEITEDIKTLGNPAGVLVSYGKIIPQSIIDLFTPGIINVHPSLLPTYRGPSPIETAMLNGDHETGVSIMQLSSAMDAGPVYAQTRYAVSGKETVDTLYAELGAVGTKLLLDTLPQILDGSLTPIPQDDSLATYCHIIKKSDGDIVWLKPAEQLEREIRAYKGWPGSRTRLGSLDIVITEASVATMGSSTPGKLMLEKSRLFVGTGKDWLEIHALKPTGKKEMPVAAFLAGYKSQLGA